MDSEIFQGNALSAVDGKSRLSIPAFIRNALVPAEPRGIYLGVQGRAPCLTVYGESYLAFLVAEQERLRLKGEDSGADPDIFEDLDRGLWGTGEKVTCDSGGRIVLGGLLREEGRIEDMALFVGRGRYAEIWNPKVAVEVGGERLQKIASYYLRQKGAKA